MNQPNHSSTQTNLTFGVAILLAMTMALGPLALDTYLPAFPSMAISLGVSVHDISLSISVYVFTLAFGQLVGGPLSDRWGRSVVLLTGLIIFGISSFLISLAETNNQLLVLRAIQAFGGGWATVCVPAMVRDQLSGAAAARFFSLIGLILITAPAIAPSIGSLILMWFDWPAIFTALSIYCSLLIIALKVFIFKGPTKPNVSTQVVSVWQRYKSVFKTIPALRYMFLQTLSFSVMLLFISHSSFIYQQHFGANPTEFSFLFGANILLMLVVNLCNRHFLKTISPKALLKFSVSLQAFGIVLLIAVTQLYPKLWLFLPAMMITVGAMGAITPNTQASFMDYFSEHSGTASALLGATQFCIAGLISAASALLPESLSAVVFAQAGCSILCLLLILTQKKELSIA